MRFFYLPALIAAAVLALAGCGRDPGQARKGLAKMNYAFTPEDFLRAARAGDEKAVQLFLNGGMDVNSESGPGTTALIAAAENDAARVIPLLLSKGAEANHKDAEGWTALMKAVYAGRLAAVQALAGAAREELNPALLLASLLGHTEVAKALILAGAEVDTASDDGSTPLHYAAKSGNLALAMALLDAHADRTLADKSGATPADVAAAQGGTAISALLNGSPTVSLAPAPTPASAGPAGQATPTSVPWIQPATTSSRSSAEAAWWKTYGIDPDAAGAVEADPDQDHFNNGEEFLADTSPVDPGSHPPFAQKMQWRGYKEDSLPFILAGVKTGQAVLETPDQTRITVQEGSEASGWKVLQITQASGIDKDGNRYDASRVILQNSAGEKLRLVPGIRSHSAGSYGRIHLPFLEEDLRLRSGETFSVPGDGGRSYLVLDVRSDQVVLKDLKSGGTFTVGP